MAGLHELCSLLDGPYGAVRAAVRQNLADRAGLLTEVLELDRHAYQDRVLDLLLQATAEGHTGRGFPRSMAGTREPPGITSASLPDSPGRVPFSVDAPEPHHC